MKHVVFVATLFALVAMPFAQTKSAPCDFSGIWHTEDEGMILTFTAKDSLFVTSPSDETIKGKGTYAKTSDSTFTATIKNDDLTIKMTYLYRWKGVDTVSAKAILFTINDESVEQPQEWMNMVRSSDRKPKR